MKYWEEGLLRISDNHKYLQNGEKPFFWLGDTAWLMFQKCSQDEAYLYMKNRKDKGYNVIQAVLIQSIPKAKSMEQAGIRLDLDTPEYWNDCDAMIRAAEELGLYIGLLPVWGSLVNEGIINLDNVERYASFLAERYKNSPNIIWILGGDIRGSVAPELYEIFGKILKEKNPDQLVGFHPFGRTSSSLWFHEASWLDFNLFQSGHRRYDQASLGEWDDNKVKEEFFGEDNWRYVDRDHSYDTMKPTLDGEPSYEGIPQGLHDPKEPYWEAVDVRRYAYWSVFQGAAGHTYGDNAVMQFYHDLRVAGSYGVREVWQDAIHHEGSGHMKHLKDLMTRVDFIHGAPAECLLLSGQKEKYHRISVFAGADYILCYDYLGEEFTLDLKPYEGRKLEAYWMDPVSGIYSYCMDATGMDSITVKPIRRAGSDRDWVLYMKECNEV
ncbi:MAG: DUF4038 domain-containing protein [Hungatella sp.]